MSTREDIPPNTETRPGRLLGWGELQFAETTVGQFLLSRLTASPGEEFEKEWEYLAGLELEL